MAGSTNEAAEATPSDKAREHSIDLIEDVAAHQRTVVMSEKPTGYERPEDVFDTIPGWYNDPDAPRPARATTPPPSEQRERKPLTDIEHAFEKRAIERLREL
jgi:hypothetical protein